MPQIRDLEVVDVLPTDRKQQEERPHPGDGPCEPAPPGAQVAVHEPGQRHEPETQGHVRQSDGHVEFCGRPGPHHRQFTEREAGGGECRDRKEQRGPNRAVLVPDQQVNRRQREARRRDHRPDDSDPADRAHCAPVKPLPFQSPPIRTIRGLPFAVGRHQDVPRRAHATQQRQDHSHTASILAAERPSTAGCDWRVEAFPPMLPETARRSGAMSAAL